MTLITIRNIHKVYSTKSGQVKALNGIDYDFKQGKFYAIIGRSGSGKSTLLHILGGLDSPTEGEVMIDGENIYTLSDRKRAIFRRRYMGFVFQKYNLLEDINVMNNILMPLKLDGRKCDKDFLAQILSTLGLENKTKKYPSELSGGEQQRVAIARSLVAKPKLIMADEPTGNLDKKTGEETIELLRDCATTFGQTLIIVTHDPSLAERADVVIKIEDGKIM